MKTVPKPMAATALAAWLAFSGAITPAFFSALLGGCDGGSSSETVGMAQGIAEATSSADGIAVRTDAGNSVGVYAAGYIPYLDPAASGFADSAAAGADGIALFRNLDPGRYNVLVRQVSGGKAALIADLAVPASGNATQRARLEATGTLAGTIADSLPAYEGLIYLPGTPFFAAGDSLMRYALTGLPQGNHKVVKTWKKLVPCDSSRICGGNPLRADSSLVRILPGVNATW